MNMSSNGQSVMTSKAGLNINMPSFGPQSQWQGNSVSYMAPITQLNQLALTTRAALGPQPLWPTLGQPYPNYFGPQMANPYQPMGPPPPPPGHSHCCMSSCQSYHHSMDHNCNSNWPTSSSGGGPPGANCWTHRDGETSGTANAASIVESITEIKTDDSDNESTKSAKKETDLQKQLKQTKAINKGLKSTIEETTTQLNEIQESLLKINEKLAMDYIEKYQQNLKKYGSYIRDECNRFIQNPSMAKKLAPIVEQMKTASKKATDEKEKLKKLFAAKRETIKEDVTVEFDDLVFDPKSLPEFPDLFEFYKTILDEIPLIFFNDLSQIKRFANNCVQQSIESRSEQKKPTVGDQLPSSLASTLPPPTTSSSLYTPPEYSLPTCAQTLFSMSPNVKDLPKPDFSLLTSKDNTMNALPLKPAEPAVTSALELTFPRNPSPIPIYSQLPNTSADTLLNTCSRMNGIQSSNGKEMSAIGEPFLKKSVQNTAEQNNADVFRQPRTAPRFGLKAKANIAAPVSEPTASPSRPEPKAPLNQAQSKLLAKLKEKYTQLSDDILVDSMSQTKNQLITTGSHPKGFTGMKISEIISKISDYIDRNVVLMNSFAKTRPNGTIPALKLMTDNLTDALNGGQKAPSYEMKGWTQVSHKMAVNDEVMCSICMEPMFMANRYETECHHLFHSECITSWARSDGTCPICRSHVLPPGEYPVL